MSNQITTPRRTAVEAFFAAKAVQRAQQPTGRLIFGVDATGSRGATWNTATELQVEMFSAVSGLSLQLVYYRGPEECKSTRWFSDGRALGDAMRTISCRVGPTQIGRVLEHARKEHAKQKVAGLVFVGDCMEEDHNMLCATARELGLPCFIFQEGDNPKAAKTFAEIARLTNGAHCCFDQGSAQQLAELLRAVAIYAVGGLKALDVFGGASAVRLLQQMK
jgi:hypothetical protein